MSIKTALDINKLEKVNGGVYYCVDKEKEEFKLVPLENVSVIINNKSTSLEELFEEISNKNKTILEKGITSQSQLKAMKKAINPMRQGEELYNILIQTKNIIKERKSNKIMKWIKENKGAILTMTVGILSLVSTLCSYLIEEWNIVLNVNGFPLIAVIGGSATTIIGCITMPITSTTVGAVQNMATNQFKQAKKTNASIIKKYDEQIASNIERVSTGCKLN